MDRESVNLRTLSDATGIMVTVLVDILARVTSATIDEVLNLAEFFGTTTEALISPPTDERAQGWN